MERLWEDVSSDFEQARDTALEAVESVRERVADYADQAQEIHQRGDRLLRLVRAVGDPPNVGGLDLNRREVAYVIDAANAVGVDMTPAIARINRAVSTVQAVGQAADAAEDLMASFGVAMPVRELAEELVPDALQDFDLSRVFPDMAGMKLPGLFKDFKFPSVGAQTDAIKVKHGFDRQTRTAWLDAKLDVPLGRPAEVFALGPVNFKLNSGAFAASARVEAPLQGKITQASRGKVSGDFALTVVGWRVVNFKDTKLTFDEQGNVKFDISPDRVELSDALQFLVKLLQNITADSGFVIEPIEVNGETTGLVAVLDLALPDLGAGAFAITGLTFHSGLELIVKPEFAVGVRLSLGSRTAPFQLTIAFLTGGGYVISKTRYISANGEMSQELAISANAGAGAAFNFGVIKGHVSLVVGIEVAFYWRNRGGQSLAIELYVLARGGITVLGILNVDLSLRLAVRYEGSGLFCHGTLTFTVRLSIFAKIKVRERATYRLSGSGGGSSGNYSDGYA